MGMIYRLEQRQARRFYLFSNRKTSSCGQSRELLINSWLVLQPAYQVLLIC
jgi:hypothetical protein